VESKRMARQKGETREREAPITEEEFKKHAKPLPVSINGIPFAAVVKLFSTGSYGYYLNGKTVVEINGVAVPVQIGLNLTVIGSKKAPKV
jgi:hypothetical protein